MACGRGTWLRSILVWGGPGQPGHLLPTRGEEKDHLQIGLLLREELKKRGIGVRMTRTTDT
jgi:N-acetylmuramoyl-L-alanine amidase